MKINEITSGIYKIQNLVNNKIYIGSAVNLSRRKNSHSHYLRKNKHPNIHLQRSYNKYNEEDFMFSVIEKCSLEVLIDKEQFYIDTLKPDYNICKIAGSSIGRKPTKETINKMKESHSKRDCSHSNETKIKMSQSHKGKTLSKQHKEKLSKSLCKPIIQMDKNSNTIRTFKSTKEAFRETNISNITSVLKGIRKSAGGFMWRYKNVIAC